MSTMQGCHCLKVGIVGNVANVTLPLGQELDDNESMPALCSFKSLKLVPADIADDKWP